MTINLNKFPYTLLTTLSCFWLIMATGVGLPRYSHAEIVSFNDNVSSFVPSLPVNLTLNAGQPMLLTLTALPNTKSDAITIEPNGALPDGVSLSTTKYDAQGNWHANLVWTPSPTQVGNYKLRFLTKTLGLYGAIQDQYTLNATVLSKNHSITSIRKVTISQAKLQIIKGDSTKLLLKVKGSVQFTGEKRPNTILGPVILSAIDRNNEIIAPEIKVNRNGNWSYSSAIRVDQMPCLLKAESNMIESKSHQIPRNPASNVCISGQQKQVATSLIKLGMNFDAANDIPVVPFMGPDSVTGWSDPSSYNFRADINVFDSRGKSHITTYYFSKTNRREWALYSYVDNLSIDPVAMTGRPSPVKITFDETGQLASIDGNSDNFIIDYRQRFGKIYLSDGAKPLQLQLDLTGTTEIDAAFYVSELSAW